MNAQEWNASLVRIESLILELIDFLKNRPRLPSSVATVAPPTPTPSTATASPLPSATIALPSPTAARPPPIATPKPAQPPPTTPITTSFTTISHATNGHRAPAAGVMMARNVLALSQGINIWLSTNEIKQPYSTYTEIFHKKMSVTGANEDIISNFPSLLIDSILERLPIQDAVRTSILSTKWRYRWTAMSALDFGMDFSEKFVENVALGGNAFIRIINHVLFFHKGPILKFDLHIPEGMVLNNFQEIDQWMLLLSRKGVQELILNNFNRRYQLPSYFFNCMKLRRLHLENCTVNPPLEFQGFSNLEHLCLLYIDFGSNLSGSTMNLPRLKHLTMITCTNAYVFNIKATKLQDLFVTACPDIPLVQLFPSPCLTKLTLHSWKPTQGSPQVEKMSLAMMFSDLPDITNIGINGRFLKLYIAENIPKSLPHTVDSLMCLSLNNIKFGDRFQLQAVLCMLRVSPNLEKLYVSNDQMGLGDTHAEPTLYCLDQPLNRLRTVEITSVEGLQVELLFIKLLLRHSPNLKKMIIQLQTTIDAHKRDNFAKNVMGFARASVEVEIEIDTIPALRYPSHD